MREFEPTPENQPEQQPMRLEFEDGEHLDLSPDNTLAFLHESDIRYDHLFIHEEESDDEAEETMGYYYFRHEVPNFDNIVWHMRNGGFNIIDKDEVSDLDRQNFHANHGTEAVVTVADVEAEVPDHPEALTPRRERFVAYFAYLLENNHLEPADFNRDGDLYI